MKITTKASIKKRKTVERFVMKPTITIYFVKRNIPGVKNTIFHTFW
jgi:hypothetical protein